MSDGVTDSHRSNEIEKEILKINIYELNFFANPTQENLQLVYSACKNLYDLPYSRGFFGENPRSISEAIKERYGKFEGKKDIKITWDDFAEFLNITNSEMRLEEIALFSTIKEHGTKHTPERYKSYTQKVNYLKSRVTINDQNILQSEEKISGEELESLVTSWGIRDKFSFN